MEYAERKSFAKRIEIPLTPPVANPLVDLKKYIPVDIMRMPRLRNAKYFMMLKKECFGKEF